MSEAEREVAIAPMLAAMRSASKEEVLLATYWREAAAGRGAEAMPILDTLARLVPGDADVAYLHLLTQNVGKTSAEQAVNFGRFLEWFPQHTAANNEAAYVFWRAGDTRDALTAAQSLVKSAPNHPTAHATFADILMLTHKPKEALDQVGKELELSPTSPYAFSKRGMVRLMMDDIRRARADFADGLAVATTGTQRFDMMHWNAMSYLWERDAAGALRALAAIALAAKESPALPAAAARRRAHHRAAVIEAYLGTRTAVPDHLVLASGVAAHPPASHYLDAAIAYSRIGENQQAHDALGQYKALLPDSPVIPTLLALLALNANDIPTAETALARTTSTDLLTKAVRADLLKRYGNNKDANAIRDRILISSIKEDNGHQVDPLALAGRLHAMKM
jgi:predicted Zn-dependent protease